MDKYFKAVNLSVGHTGSGSIFKNINFSIDKNELLCILGPSGCGKSTLLRTIAGFNKIDPSSSIILNGRNIENLPVSDRNMSMMFQTPALFCHLNVLENILFCTKNKDYVISIAKMLDIEKIFHKYPNEISGGEQQRVAFCRALGKNGDLLLLDEPFTALDKHVKESAHEKLLDAKRLMGVSGLLVTHDQDEAMKIGDRICVLNGGVIEQIDVPMKIYQNPASKFVAQFIGKNNIMNARVENCDGSSVKLYVHDLSSHVVVPNTQKFEKNTNVSVAIRPENIVVNKKKGGILAKVIYKEYKGHMTISNALLSTGYKIRFITNNYLQSNEVYVSWKSDRNFKVFK